MKRLSITPVGGENFVFDTEDASGLADAVNRQDPCYALTVADDKSVLYLNTRQIVAWSVEDVEEEAVSDSDSDTRTVAQLKTDLEEGGITYDSSAKKADLLKLVKDNGL